MGELQTSGRPIDSLVEKVLCMNILSSDYYKELFALKTYHEIVDEIYNQVDHVEPWMTGNCRGPSTAFCLLYKFLTMKLTVKQMHSLLQHPDSPYIRAVGFLYLRYAADGKTLWNWFEPYVNDEEEFSPGSNGRKTTMGVYVRDLLLGQYYFDTLFPRVPVTALRQITSNLEKMNLPTKPSGSIGENSRFGSEDTARRPPSVKAALSVSFGQRAPHRASTRDSSPVRRILPPSSSYDRSDRDNSRRSPSRHRSQSRELSDRDRDRDRNQDLDRGRDRYRDRNRDYDRDTDRRRDYDRPRYSEREGSRRDRDSDRRNEYRSRRSRSRSRSPSQQAPSERFESHPGSRRDAGREKEKGPTSSNLAKLKDLYGDVSEKKGESSMERGYKDSATDEVFRLGGSTWR